MTMSRRTMILVALCALAAGCTKKNPALCCTDPNECISEGLKELTPCDAGLLCRGGQCIAESCTASTDCDASAPYCVMENCGEGCSDDSQCPGFGQGSSHRFCVANVCVEC